MTEAQRSELRRLLASRREALERLVKTGHAQIQKGEIADPHEQSADSAQAAEYIEMQTALTDRHLVELEAIDRADARIGDGTYGQCVDCSGDIGYARLSAYPSAERCVTCQAGYERQHGLTEHPHL